MKDIKITREDFEKYVNHAVAIMDLQDRLYDVVNDFNANNRGELDLGYFPTLLDDVVDLLAILTGDTENQWISYWFFDLNHGERYYPGCAFGPDGIEIPLATVSDLWELLNNESNAAVPDPD